VIYGIFMLQRVFQLIANVYAWLSTHGQNVENNLVYALRGFSHVASVFLCCYLRWLHMRGSFGIRVACVGTHLCTFCYNQWRYVAYPELIAA
jgi:hypothetical protein